MEEINLNYQGEGEERGSERQHEGYAEREENRRERPQGNFDSGKDAGLKIQISH